MQLKYDYVGLKVDIKCKSLSLESIKSKKSGKLQVALGTIHRETATRKFMLRRYILWFRQKSQNVTNHQYTISNLYIFYHLKYKYTTSSHFSGLNSIKSPELSSYFTIQFHIVRPNFLQLRLHYLNFHFVKKTTTLKPDFHLKYIS